MTMPKEIWADNEDINSDGELEGRWNEVGAYSPSTKYTHHTVHEDEIAKRESATKALTEALEAARDIIAYDFRESCNKSLTDIEKMQRDALKQTLEQINQILGEENDNKRSTGSSRVG